MQILLDKNRNLSITGFTIMKYEKATGKSLFSIGENPTMTDIIHLLWAFLEDEINIEDVARMVNLKNIKSISEVLTALMSEATSGNEEAYNI
jgi:hypothetical protein